MAQSRVTLAGVVAHDPEQRTTANGARFVRFRLGVTERKQDPSGAWSDGLTSWFQVEAWGTLGKNAGASLLKGQRVLVHGVLTVREFAAKDGGTGRSTEVRAESIGHDLVFGTSRFERVTKTQPAQPQPQAQSAAQVPVAAQATAQVDHSNEWAAPGTTTVLEAADDFDETPF